MKTKVSERYNAVIVELKGNVMGGDDTKEFNDMLHKFIGEGKKNIVVDLHEVKFMNSSGLGMLIGGLTTLKKSDGTFRLSRITDKIESLLIITKLITIFETYKTIDEAVASFAK
jgi:anti-sigma B factor antagonist